MARVQYRIAPWHAAALGGFSLSSACIPLLPTIHRERQCREHTKRSATRRINKLVTFGHPLSPLLVDVMHHAQELAAQNSYTRTGATPLPPFLLSCLGRTDGGRQLYSPSLVYAAQGGYVRAPHRTAPS